MCRSNPNKTPECYLNCNKGTCKIIPEQGPKCVCPAPYSGTRCEHNMCSQYCKNHGHCYVDTHALKPSESQPPLKCQCPPQWTGEHCEKAVDLCENRCFNGGTCTLLKTIPHCTCSEGFSGNRCQNCVDLVCKNGGICSKNEGIEICSCPEGYKGKNCEHSVCGKHGRPIVTSEGLKCDCISGYTGEKCNRSNCDQHCQNGGICRMGIKQLECICPKYFGGRRCEIDLCQRQSPPEGCNNECNCENGGVCMKFNTKSVCQCPSEWGGYFCEVGIQFSITIW